MNRVSRFGLFITTVILASGCESTVDKAERWEYKIVVIDPLNNKNIFQIAQEGITEEQLLEDYNKKLNDMGKKGWELVSAPKDTPTLYFKRKL